MTIGIPGNRFGPNKPMLRFVTRIKASPERGIMDDIYVFKDENNKSSACRMWVSMWWGGKR